jgi:hypothetical protein
MIAVKLPAGPKDLRIHQFKSMVHIPTEGFESEQDSLVFLAEFLDITYNQVLDFTKKDIRKMTAIAVRELSKMDITSALPKSINIQGQEFELVDPDKIGIGWFIDYNASSITADPVRLSTLFYVQKGFNYSDVDQNGNILYPIESRYKLFKENFPLDLFIRSSSFFLRKSLTSTKLSMVRELSQNKTQNKVSSFLRSLSHINGRRR